MGGPWKERGFDPLAWRPPAPHGESGGGGSDLKHDPLTRIVVGYIVAVLASSAFMLGFMKYGW